MQRRTPVIVMLVDEGRPSDHRVAEWLRADPAIDLVHCPGGLDELDDLAPIVSPDVVLVRPAAEEADPIRIISTVLAAASGVAVVLCRPRCGLDMFLQCVAAGGRGVVSTSTPADQLLDAIRCVAAGGCVLDGPLLHPSEAG